MDANQKTLPNKICRLCKTRPAIKNSHILPKFVGRKAKKATGSIRFIALTGDEKSPQDTAKIPLLCKECEARFNKLETPFANRWFQLYPNHPADSRADETTVRFYNSVAWRVLQFLIENRSIPEQSILDAEATECFLRNHLYDETPVPPWNSYIFYASDFAGIPDAPPQEYLRYAAAFAMVLFWDRALFFEQPIRPAIISVIGPFIHVFELQPSEAVVNTKPENWEDFKLEIGQKRSFTKKPPPELTRWLTRILCTPREQFKDDDLASIYRMTDDDG